MRVTTGCARLGLQLATPGYTKKEMEQERFYEKKLEYEIDAWDLYSALNMTKLGFRVKELMGGLDWWKRDGYVTGGTQSTGGRGVSCGC